jgi:hypothetical protein
MSAEHYRTDAAGGAFVYRSDETPEEHDRRFDAWVSDFHRNSGPPVLTPASARAPAKQRDSNDPLPGETAAAYRARMGMPAARQDSSGGRVWPRLERTVAKPDFSAAPVPSRIDANSTPEQIAAAREFANNRTEDVPATTARPGPVGAYERNIRASVEAARAGSPSRIKAG